MSEPLIIGPQPGPQTTVLACPADIAIMGGSAGGGKSMALLLDALRVALFAPGSSSIIIRRNTTMLRGAGSLFEKAKELYATTGASFLSGAQLLAKFPNGSQIEFSHFQHVTDDKKYQGKDYDFVGFDEICQFESSQLWYLWSRLRSMYGARPYLRATCNPDPDSFVRQLIEWWIGPDGYAIPERSGVLRWFVRPEGKLVWGDSPEELRDRYKLAPKSFTFIRSSLTDNPALMAADPEYIEKLRSLPLVKRRQLLDGDWDIKAGGGTVFRRDWFGVQRTSDLGFKRIVRVWDLAATEPSPENEDPDWTVGALIGLTHNGYLVVLDVVQDRRTPGGVEALVRATADQDGAGVTVGFWQDPGQAGKSQIDAFRRLLSDRWVEVMVARSDKLTYAYVWSAMAEPREGESHGRVILSDAIDRDTRNQIMNQAQAFPEVKHDDIVDSISLGAVILLEAQEPVPYHAIHIEDL